MRESRERGPGEGPNGARRELTPVILSLAQRRGLEKNGRFSKNPHFDFEPQNHINYFYNLLNCVNVPNMPKTRRGGGVYKHVTTK